MQSEPAADAALRKAAAAATGLVRVHETEPAAPARPRWRTLLHAASVSAYTFAALFLFVFALQLLKGGAGGLKPILKALSVHGPLNLLGFGWLGAYSVMSGSPVAAISL